MRLDQKGIPAKKIKTIGKSDEWSTFYVYGKDDALMLVLYVDRMM